MYPTQPARRQRSRSPLSTDAVRAITGIAASNGLSFSRAWTQLVGETHPLVAVMGFGDVMTDRLENLPHEDAILDAILHVEDGQRPGRGDQGRHLWKTS